MVGSGGIWVIRPKDGFLKLQRLTVLYQQTVVVTFGIEHVANVVGGDGVTVTLWLLNPVGRARYPRSFGACRPETTQFKNRITQRGYVTLHLIR
jgi:hypothetical protein